MGRLLLIHSPAVIREMTVPEAMACLEADQERRQEQFEAMAVMMGAKLG